MASIYEDLYEIPSCRHTFAGGSQPTRNTRSWTNNGVHYVVETSSYAGPSYSFGMMGSTVRQPGRTTNPVQPQPRTQGPGLIGTAFNLFGSMLAARQAQTAQRNARRNVRQPSPDDSAYGNDYSGGQPRTLFSNFPGGSSAGPQHSRRRDSARTNSPRRRRPQGGEGRRSRSYRENDEEPPRRKSRTAYVEDFTDEESDEESNDDWESRPRHSRRAFTQDDESIAEALENAASHHRREANQCRTRIQQLSGQPMASSATLQTLLNELKRHESAYENARENLKLMQDNRRRNTQQDHRSNRRDASTTETEGFGASTEDDFESFFQRPRQQHPLFDGFDSFPGMPFSAFNSFFNDFGTRSTFNSGMPDFFFPMPGASFNTGPQSHARTGPQPGAQFPPQAGFSTFTPQPKPPANLLKPEEAKRLFKTYNERWTSLALTDPNIPYPARKLHPTGLLVRDSIWAPMVNSSVEEWSEEAVMQANTQAFFLGVVGLSPQYSETSGTGKIVAGFNKAQANAPQVKELVDILKKEKVRWHSDRLGRRTGGRGGVNEALQRDEKARAVFHAVCELMEAAQGA